MVQFSNLVIFMALFYCTLAVNDPITDNNDNTMNCEEFNESCEKCNTDQPCHFVIWISKEKNINHTRCMDVALTEAETKKQGPFGNQKENSHWSTPHIFYNKTQCNNASYFVDTGKDIKITLLYMLM